jgi:hypothetical protein
MPQKKKAKREIQYFRIIITYCDGETSGHRVFTDRDKAEKWAERQRKSGVVKKASVEPFTRQSRKIDRTDISK